MTELKPAGWSAHTTQRWGTHGDLSKAQDINYDGDRTLDQMYTKGRKQSWSNCTSVFKHRLCFDEFLLDSDSALTWPMDILHSDKYIKAVDILHYDRYIKAVDILH